MLRAELVKQLLRARSLLALGAVAALPIIAALTTAGHAGTRNGTQGGLYGAASYSALNHAAASLEFTAPLLLALVVALLGSALGAADRDWGTLRYLYLRPVSLRRLLLGKWSALAVCVVLATSLVLVTALAFGLVVFGWHPFHRVGSPTLSDGTAALKLLEAGGYVAACLLSVGTIAFALGVLLPGQAEALAASVAFVVILSILDGQRSLHAVTAALPVHYWQRWTALFSGGHAGLLTGLIAQLSATAVALGVAWLGAIRRDPAA